MRIGAGSSFLPHLVSVHFSCSQSLRTQRANQTNTGSNGEREDRRDNGRVNPNVSLKAHAERADKEQEPVERFFRIYSLNGTNPDMSALRSLE